MRLFVGTLLRPSVQASCGEAIQLLARRHAGMLRVVPPGSAHITYAFCGKAPDGSIAAIVAAIRKAVASHRPISVTLGTPVIVPALARPRLVAIPIVGGEHDLEQLAGDVSGAVQAGAAALPWSPNRVPHVTLARFRRPAKRHETQMVLQSLRNLGEPKIHDRIDAVHVVVSQLTPRGPVYRVSGDVPIPAG